MKDPRDYGLNPQRPEVIDSSMLKEYCRCPSAFYLRYVLGLQPKMGGAKTNVGLNWGSKWHDLMYAYFHDYDQDEALRAIMPWPSCIDGSDRHARTMERMVMIFFDYIERYAEMDQTRSEIIRREQYFDIQVDAGDQTPFGVAPVSLRWCGRSDKLISESRKVKVVDYKTTSYQNAVWMDEHKHGFQIPGYVFANSMLFGKFIPDAVLDVLYTLKSKHEFSRPQIRYTKDHILEWMHNVERWTSTINRMLDDHLYDLEAWHQNRNGCTPYGHLCDYADVHFSPDFNGRTRLPILQQDYVEDRWEPSDI